MKRFYTAESVTEGHPDKLCDLIADSVLDECLKGDSNARVACEVLATKGRIIVAGEITSRQNPDVSETVKRVLEDVGYSPEEIQIDVFLHRQSPDIAEAVARSLEQREGLSEREDGWNEGAGDQGIMTGFACQETPSLMPMPVVLANRIVRELSACRKSGYIAGILPDGKAQVTVEYEDGKPVRLSSVVVSCQHREDKGKRELEREIREKVLKPALHILPPDEDTEVYMASHGGGAFSGKDCSKVDRCGAYMARYIAKNIVAAGLAEKCQVILAYAIGVAEPVMVQVDTFGTGKVCADDCLVMAVQRVFGLTPEQIAEKLRLKRPIYRQTAVFGHFGRKEFPWEQTDQAGKLKDTVM